MTEPTDGALVARVLAGDRHAFGGLVDRHQDRMLAYVRHMGFGEAEACDIVQDAFVRAFRHLRRCGDPERFDGWLFRIVSNLCRTAGARGKRRRSEPLEPYSTTLESEGPGPDAAAEKAWLRDKLRAALDVLPGEQREAIVLMYLEDRSVQEIEQLCGASSSAIKMRLKRGREALRRELEPLFSEAHER